MQSRRRLRGTAELERARPFITVLRDAPDFIARLSDAELWDAIERFRAIGAEDEGGATPVRESEYATILAAEVEKLDPNYKNERSRSISTSSLTPSGSSAVPGAGLMAWKGLAVSQGSALSLARVSTERLEAVWRRLGALPAKTRVDEEQLGDPELAEVLEPLLGQPAWVLGSLLEAVLAERGNFSPPTASAGPKVEYRIDRHHGATSPELVWSGDTGRRSCARKTRYVIEDLFASARDRVLMPAIASTTPPICARARTARCVYVGHSSEHDGV